MNSLAMIQCQPRQGVVYDMVCPYNGVTVCLASLSAMKIDIRRRSQYCVTENFDDCPIFLSKVLRRS